jgi:A/G-specific adenine glycosylase
VEPEGCWPVLRHTFSHFHLDITPVLARLGAPGGSMDGDRQVWYKPGQSDERGLAAPVAKLVTRYFETRQERAGDDTNRTVRKTG